MTSVVPSGELGTEARLVFAVPSGSPGGSLCSPFLHCVPCQYLPFSHCFGVLMLLPQRLASTVLPSYSPSPSLAYREFHSTVAHLWPLPLETSTHRYPQNSHDPQPTFPSLPLPIFKSTRRAISFLLRSTISVLKYSIPPVVSKSGVATLEKRHSLPISSQSSKSRSTFRTSPQMIRILPGWRGITHAKTQGRTRMGSGLVRFSPLLFRCNV